MTILARPMSLSAPLALLHALAFHGMMVDAGLSPYEVLVTGTRNPAVYFGTPEEFGTVEVGRRADLILLEADPLQDTANARRIAGVMVRGQWLPRSEIEQRLDEIASRVAGDP